MTWIALLLLGTVPLDIPVQDKFSICEHNHFFDEHGQLVFDQFLFKDWNKATCRFDVQAWRLDKGKAVKVGNSLLFYDGDTLRRIRFDDFQETWSQYDPECIDRQYFPKEQRRDLLNGRRFKP